MKPSETANGLAKYIVNKVNDAIEAEGDTHIKGEEIAQWIEDTYGEGLVSKLRRKIKDQARNLKQLHRSHAELLHLSRRVLMEKAVELEEQEEREKQIAEKIEQSEMAEIAAR